VGVSNETSWGVMEFTRLAKELNLPKIVSIQNSYSLLVRTQFEGKLDTLYLFLENWQFSIYVCCSALGAWMKGLYLYVSDSLFQLTWWRYAFHRIATLGCWPTLPLLEVL
jgi:hypothetical protein